jgi:DNA (cytosine-5)-methyltransferase 1
MGLKFFDLFAGIGGFRLGMERAGHECVGSCEWDKHARETYKKNFGSYPEYDDAKDLHPQSLPYFDVLCAGFPCQAFSIAGKRMGFEDTRGTIFFEIARIAKEKRPPYLFLENVKGLLNHDKGRTFDTIISTLDEMGYDAEWQVLNSKYFVPQNRERVFIVGHLRGERTRQVFPLGEISKVFDKKKLRKEELSRSRSHSSAIDANYYKGPDGKRTLVQVGNIDTKGHNSLWGRVYDPNFIGPSLNANGGGMGAKTGLFAVSSSGRSWGRESRVKLGEANGLSCGSGCASQSSANFVYMSNTNANMKQREQERTETWTLGTSTDFGIREGMRIRKLTPKECERLQGFPDDWTIGSDTQRYKQCGNAVTVDVVEYIAKELRLG